ncbi:hypothetical protein GCM10010442_46140 [Kitasatospora kifunensis]
MRLGRIVSAVMTGGVLVLGAAAGPAYADSAPGPGWIKVGGPWDSRESCDIAGQDSGHEYACQPVKPTCLSMVCYYDLWEDPTSWPLPWTVTSPAAKV